MVSDEEQVLENPMRPDSPAADSSSSPAAGSGAASGRSPAPLDAETEALVREQLADGASVSALMRDFCLSRRTVDRLRECAPRKTQGVSENAYIERWASRPKRPNLSDHGQAESARRALQALRSELILERAGIDPEKRPSIFVDIARMRRPGLIRSLDFDPSRKRPKPRAAVRTIDDGPPVGED